MHKTTLAIATTLAATAALSLSTTGAAEASATHFANCDAMHRVYAHGVSKSNAAAAQQVRNGYGRPAVRPLVYSANSGSDRDRDGTACEA
jgi:hypothetical protein